MWVLHMPARLKWTRRFRWQVQGEVAACSVAHARPFKLNNEDWLPSSDCHHPWTGDRFPQFGFSSNSCAHLRCGGVVAWSTLNGRACAAGTLASSRVLLRQRSLGNFKRAGMCRRGFAARRTRGLNRGLHMPARLKWTMRHRCSSTSREGFMQRGNNQKYFLVGADSIALMI